jgi:hypothetical protein
MAILVAASFLIATGTRGENASQPLSDRPAKRMLWQPPAAGDDDAPRARSISFESISFDSKNWKTAPRRLAAH